MRNADYQSMLNARAFPESFDPWSGAHIVCSRCGGSQHLPGCTSDDKLTAKAPGRLIPEDAPIKPIAHDLIGAAQAAERSRRPGIRDLLHEAFRKPEKPAKAAEDKLVSIGKVAKALGLGVDATRQYIYDGIIPDAPVRGADYADGRPGRRMWPESYVRRLEKIAIDEGLRDTPRANVNSTAFSERAWRLYSRRMAEQEN